MAVCFAGAWRDWDVSWEHLQLNLVEALDADVLAVSDQVRGGINARGEADTSHTIARFRRTFGRRFRGGEYLSAQEVQFTRLSSKFAWPEVVAARKGKMFPYLLKIWRCGQLVHRAVRDLGLQYGIVVRLRPDLVLLKPFALTRLPTAPNGRPGGEDAHAVSRPERPQWQLVVGPTCVRFGQRAVVINAFTTKCGNDWFALGSYKAMAVTMDLARFATPHSKWLSPHPELDRFYRTYPGSELSHSALWWRTGTRVHRVPLYMDITRSQQKNNCTRMDCMPVSAWVSAGKKKLLGCRSSPYPHGWFIYQDQDRDWEDCSDGNGDDLDHWRPGTTKSFNADDPLSLLDAHVWSRPYCTDVPDLAAANALGACRMRKGNATWQHRPQVRGGYGSAKIFPGSPSRASLSSGPTKPHGPHGFN